MSDPPVRRYRSLDPSEVEVTIERLCARVEERFPGSGLGSVCRDLLEIAGRTAETARSIARPNLLLRISVGVLVGLILGALIGTVLALKGTLEPLRFAEMVQVLEAGINDVVLVGAAIFFLVTLETRIKRRRALAATHELRSIAHVIDMHQLTKDPEMVLGRNDGRLSAPRRPLTRFELCRYLDYCSEALSLTGKVAAVYVQRFDDPVALHSVIEVENLTTSLSRKIWQKLMILYSAPPSD